MVRLQILELVDKLFLLARYRRELHHVQKSINNALFGFYGIHFQIIEINLMTQTLKFFTTLSVVALIFDHGKLSRQSSDNWYIVDVPISHNTDLHLWASLTFVRKSYLSTGPGFSKSWRLFITAL